MSATIRVELQPFKVPNFVLVVMKPGKRDDGIQEVPCFPLSDVDSEALDKMCSDFRDAVFSKAGKEPPP